jgi:hypothetical protein
MQQKISVFRIFIASPNDLGEERQALRGIVDDTNSIFRQETDWRIELLGWEDTLPGAGRPQELINVDVDKADLFIGCLWRRWGTPSGHQGKTGFEEEFERALDRRVRTTQPEIWLFFKDVAEQERNDPGEQLKKVLEFREQEENAKRLLFQRFADTRDWRGRIAPMLNRLLLRLVKQELQQQSAPASQAQSQPDGSTTGAVTAPVTQSSSSPAVASIITLLRTASEQLGSQSLLAFRKSEAFGDARCVRLLVFAGSLYSERVQPVEFGTHETNSAYWHRQKLKLTGQERLFLIKTILNDDSTTKPGWYWSARWSTPMSAWLPWLTTADREDSVRIRAIEFAKQIQFPLHGTGAGKAIYSALEDGSVDVRSVALGYLAKHGRLSSISHIKRAAQKEDKLKLRSEAAITAIRIRSDPDRELKNLLSTVAPLSDLTLAAINENIQRVTLPLLERFLNHSNPALRGKAAAELQSRGALQLPSALQLVTDDSRRVRESGFLALIDHGVAPSPVEIRAQLSDQWFPYSLSSPGEEAQPDHVISYYFSKQPAEKLWAFVDLLDENSQFALRALSQRFFSTNGAFIRDALIDDFEQQVNPARARREQQNSTFRAFLRPAGEDPIERERKNLRTAALRGLADHPEAKDRDLFLRFLSAELSASDQTIACLRGLSHVGKESDTNAIKPLLNSSSPSVQAAAARALLALTADADGALKQLIKVRSEPVVWVIVATLLLRRDRQAWTFIEPLLGDANEEIRRLACFFALSRMTRTALLKELNDYLKLAPYYYNVVTLLDRALYAPRTAKEYFRRAEIDHFGKLSAAATRFWDGLTLGR